MWKMIFTYMYLPSMWDKGKSAAVYSVLNDFESIEEWYRSKLRSCMVQTLMEVSIQSLHVMLQDTDMDDKTAVLHTMVLKGNVRTEIEHHNTMYKKDLCKRY